MKKETENASKRLSSYCMGALICKVYIQNFYRPKLKGLYISYSALNGGQKIARDYKKNIGLVIFDLFLSERTTLVEKKTYY